LLAAQTRCCGGWICDDEILICDKIKRARVLYVVFYIIKMKKNNKKWERGR